MNVNAKYAIGLDANRKLQARGSSFESEMEFPDGLTIETFSDSVSYEARVKELKAAS